MKLRLRRGPAALAVVPDTVQPTGTVRASTTLERALDDVTGARLALGYDCTYPYRWAGRRDAAAGHDDTAWFQNDIGTDHGSDRDATDWVPVLAAELPVAGGRLDAGEHAAELRIPSWAPGSSERLVHYRVRLEVDRKGKTDVLAAGELRVLVGPPDPAPAPATLRQTHRFAERMTVDVRLASATVKAGEALEGVIVLTGDEGYPDVKVTASYQYEIVSHPLQRTPAKDREGRPGDTVELVERLALTPGIAGEVPFNVVLEAAAAPTTETVHATLGWWLKVVVMPRGFNAVPPTTTLREILVHTA